MTKQINVLLTCVGRRSYMVDYFKKALLPYGGKVFAANSHAYASGLLPADEGFLVPNLYAENYIDALIRICDQNKISAIIPLFDLELPVLAGAKERLAEEGITAVVSSREAIEICNNKWATYNYLKKHKLGYPKTFSSLDGVQKSLCNHEIDFPLVIKPRLGMGSIGIMEAENDSELSFYYEKAVRAIERSYLQHESKKDPDHMLIFQEKLIGQEFGLDVVNDLDGSYVTTFVKKKIAMRSGETDIAVTVVNQDLENLGEVIAKSLRHTANLDVDVFVSDTQIAVLEMNPRFGGGYPFSHLAGADLPAAVVAWLLGEKPDPDWFRISPNITGFKGIQPMQMLKNPLEFFDAD